MKFNGILGVDDPELHLSEEDIKWWRDAKVGLFIHWGVYSAIETGEWAYFNEKYKEEAYRKITKEIFRPKLPAKAITKEWINHAKHAGMKYAVMVTRHHDGYAMWDSDHSWKDFTAVKCGPGEDYVKEFADACHKEGLYTGFYYSPMDWRFPGYFDPEGQAESAQKMKEQTYKQIEELCTNFGQVDIIWYDGGWLAHKGSDADAAEFWESIKLNKMVRSYNEKMMVSPRSGYKGDFEVDEGSREVKGNIVPIPWEKAMSLSSVWGYKSNDQYRSLEYMIPMLVNTVCRDGNLLLNVGPDANGIIPKEAQKTLHGIGKWLEQNEEAVYGTRGGIWQPVDGIYGSTFKDDKVYLHILNCEAFSNEILPPISKKIISATLLNEDDVKFTQNDYGIRVEIPTDIQRENRLDTIVKLVLEG